MSNLKVEDPLQILAENKKQEIIDAYCKKYNLNPWLLSKTWDFLKENADDKTVKALKKGELKKGVKPIVKQRPTFTDGMIFKAGKVISEEEYLILQEEDKKRAMDEYLASVEQDQKLQLEGNGVKLEEILEDVKEDEILKNEMEEVD